MPEELRAWRQWVVWKLLDPRKEGAKPVKLLCNPRTGQPARTQDDPDKSYQEAAAQTWGSYEEAVRAFRRGGWAGIGFVFTEDDPFIGGDIDDCRNPETGEIDARAGAFVTLADTYTEISQSGTGVKFIGRGRKVSNESSKRDKFEMYDHGRYFALTGCRLDGTPATIEEREGEFAGIYYAWFPEKGKEARHAVAARPRKPVDLADAELLTKAGQSTSGAAFDALWRGDTKFYADDHSSADLALCGMLAFWTGGDVARMDSLFRQSGLYRDKWDEKRGTLTYGERTLGKALQGRTEFYDPSRFSPAGENSTERQDSVLQELTLEAPPQMDAEAWQKAFLRAWSRKRDSEILSRLVIGALYRQEVTNWAHGQKTDWLRKQLNDEEGRDVRNIQNWASVGSAFPRLTKRALHGQYLWQDGDTPKTWDFLRELAPRPEEIREEYLKRAMSVEEMKDELRAAGVLKPVKHEPKEWARLASLRFSHQMELALYEEGQKEDIRAVEKRVLTALGRLPAGLEEVIDYDREKEQIAAENRRLRLQVETQTRQIETLTRELVETRRLIEHHFSPDSKGLCDIHSGEPKISPAGEDRSTIPAVEDDADLRLEISPAGEILDAIPEPTFRREANLQPFVDLLEYAPHERFHMTPDDLSTRPSILLFSRFQADRYRETGAAVHLANLKAAQAAWERWRAEFGCCHCPRPATRGAVIRGEVSVLTLCDHHAGAAHAAPTEGVWQSWRQASTCLHCDRAPTHGRIQTGPAEWCELHAPDGAVRPRPGVEAQ